MYNAVYAAALQAYTRLTAEQRTMEAYRGGAKDAEEWARDLAGMVNTNSESIIYERYAALGQPAQ